MRRCSFPKWGLANGKKQIGQLFTDFGGGIKSILHDYATFNWIMTGTDVFAVEGTSAGEYKDGPWRAGVSHAGRWCDVFEVRDFLIQRCFIYLDPDYAGLDTARYHWLSAGGRDPSKPMAIDVGLTMPDDCGLVSQSVADATVAIVVASRSRLAARRAVSGGRARPGRHRQRAGEVSRRVDAGRRDSRRPSVRQPHRIDAVATR